LICIVRYLKCTSALQQWPQIGRDRANGRSAAPPICATGTKTFSFRSCKISRKQHACKTWRVLRPPDVMVLLPFFSFRPGRRRLMEDRASCGDGRLGLTCTHIDQRVVFAPVCGAARTPLRLCAPSLCAPLAPLQPPLRALAFCNPPLTSPSLRCGLSLSFFQNLIYSIHSAHFIHLIHLILSLRLFFCPVPKGGGAGYLMLCFGSGVWTSDDVILWKERRRERIR